MPTDIGPPDYKTMLPPVIQRNYGMWRYHEILQPGVLMHIAQSDEALYTVRAASALRTVIATGFYDSRVATTSSFCLMTKIK